MSGDQNPPNIVYFQVDNPGSGELGYLGWSVTTKREWGLQAGPHGNFGLYHIDLDSDPPLARRRPPGAAPYAASIRTRRA